MPDPYDILATAPVLMRRNAGLAGVSGPDRVSWLQGMVSNDVARLGPGEGCYAAHLNAKGRVLSLMRVLADSDVLWLEFDQDVAAAVAELDKLLIMEDAEVADRSGGASALSLAGPGAGAVLEACFGSPLVSGRYRHRRFGNTHVIRGEIAYDLILPEDEVDAVVRALSDQGAIEGGADLWNLLTLEAGLPAYGLDVDETTTLPELGERGINYEKGCYIGQEVVAKIRYIGHVNRHFVGFRISGDAVPAPGSAVRSGQREIGRITRAAYSPGADGVVALGFVRMGSENPGTSVEIVGDNVVHAAQVSALPFLSRTAD